MEVHDWRRMHWGDTRLHHSGADRVPVSGAALLVVQRVTPKERALVEACCKRSLTWCAATEEGAGHSLEAWITRARHLLNAGLAVAVASEDLVGADGQPWPMHRWLSAILGGATLPVLPVAFIPHWGHDQEGGPGHWIPRQTQLHEKRADVAFGKPIASSDADGRTIREQLDRLSADAAIARKPHNLSPARLFLRVARKRWAQPCLLDGAVATGEMTFGRALTASLLMAEAFKRQMPGEEMVGVWLPTGTGAALVNTAIGLMGRVAINLNYTATQAVNDACLEQTTVRTIVTARRFLARMPFEPGSRKLLILEDVVGKATGWAKARAYARALLMPLGWLEAWLGCDARGPDDLATIVFSSGSTGAPKGVELTCGNLVANIQSLVTYGDIFPEDRMLGVLPFFHSFGFTVTLWAPLTQGMSVAYYPDPRQGRDVGALCRRHRSTVMLSTATFLRFCLKRAEVGDFRSVRFLVCGAEKLPVSLAREFQERFGVLPIEGYGCTELAPVTNINLPDIPLADGKLWWRDQPGSVGRMVTGCHARILEPDTGAPMPAGEPGMIHIAGANVMRGYHGQPAKTSEAVKDGYYKTGDIGYLDERCHLVITGRLSRFAKSGGEMVPLERVEQILHEELPTNERVCGVTCVPDATRGEKVVLLYVRAMLDEHGLDIKAWLKKLAARGVPPLWVPSEKDCHPVEEIPALGSGKLDLQSLKRMALERAGSNGS